MLYEVITNNGDMFYITNTDSIITLNNVDLTLADGTYLILIAGNDGSRGWGSAGSNGGICEVNFNEQTVSGDIMVDSISEMDLSISDGSSYIGAINPDGTAASVLSVTIDDTSTWTLRITSYNVCYTKLLR